MSQPMVSYEEEVSSGTNQPVHIRSVSCQGLINLYILQYSLLCNRATKTLIRLRKFPYVRQRLLRHVLARVFICGTDSKTTLAVNFMRIF